MRLFLFVGACEYMRRTFSELVKRFRGIVGRSERETISQNDFNINGYRANSLSIEFSLFFGISYRPNFSVPCRRFILALNGISIFYHILPYFDKNITESVPSGIDKNFTM